METETLILELSKIEGKKSYLNRLTQFREATAPIVVDADNELSSMNSHAKHEDHTNHSDWNKGERNALFRLKLATVIRSNNESRAPISEISAHTDHSNHTNWHDSR